MTHPSRTRRDLRRRVLGVLPAVGAAAIVASAVLVVAGTPHTSAAYRDDAYLNLTAGGGTPMGTPSYDLMFRYRTSGTWSSGESGMSEWIQADADGGIDVPDAVNCRTPLMVAGKTSDASACHAEIQVRNMSPQLASFLTTTVAAGPDSDPGMAAAVRYGLWSGSPTSRFIYVDNNRLGAVTTLVSGPGRTGPLLTAHGTANDNAHLEFIFWLSDQGAAGNAALKGKSLSLQISFAGRSEVLGR
ncbi:hypothetical protein [Leifsonia aquatica]|uniref:Uncharacterized protein n=2 Tax=Leifsonia aquatica TaxID=144185 RepID=U2TEZ1_LEIAQ|nr:hypothetical protein [Leifsonia aquatica]ERK73267.1 hypothetical protein N136_00361 [Leifsonia aquatica ATCC 14665]MBB2967675.1 hypothetical protein [Leifsonia aquatica]